MADIDAELEDLGRNARFGSDTRGRRARTTRQPGDHPKVRHTSRRDQSRRRGVGHSHERVDGTGRGWRWSRAEDAASRAIVFRRRDRRRAIRVRRADCARDGCELMPDDHASDAEAREQRLQCERVGRDQRDPCPACAPAMRHDGAPNTTTYSMGIARAAKQRRRRARARARRSRSAVKARHTRSSDPSPQRNIAAHRRSAMPMNATFQASERTSGMPSAYSGT
jgi:hypothetical protein